LAQKKFSVNSSYLYSICNQWDSVALMAVVVSNQEAFKYWHGSQGNQIFATISILIYGLFAVFCFSQMNQHVQI